MLIKNTPKIRPGLIFRGGGYFRDDICVKNQGAYFRVGGGGLIFGGLIIGILRYLSKLWCNCI